mmetsp:Transcript_3839/g.11317  ORF Transcript_3839/g.11317 Transcript_3839/m.11317 type:complete len:136 (-) Transcript_3839:170-577(-)|eukprot:CAMPEP_0168422682 /NCGR_PEP_ID=MMETSP0228-20121227/33921_1 /TAXON_ID=133427 /ORGANISM="Protoceratium reticulatum, Strain CCCM 535 (=CCMP 1889)" /LENGTH=135 /DNA_ID=CAMNT_0008436625 /DNA_START=53 /DNA_END=460 /DNA_ORIENTATION=-
MGLGCHHCVVLLAGFGGATAAAPVQQLRWGSALPLGLEPGGAPLELLGLGSQIRNATNATNSTNATSAGVPGSQEHHNGQTITGDWGCEYGPCTTPIPVSHMPPSAAATVTPATAALVALLALGQDWCSRRAPRA